MPTIDLSANSLPGILVRDVVIPELLAFIRGFHASSGSLPTSEQVLAEYETNRQRYLTVGESFLARTAPVNP